jgi:hypothetical protein
MVCQKGLHESYRMGRCIVMMKLICSLGQRRLTGELLAPQESENSRTHSKFSSDWLPSYIKATRPVLEIFKMAGYFPDSPRISIVRSLRLRCWITTLVVLFSVRCVLEIWCCWVWVVSVLQPEAQPATWILLKHKFVAQYNSTDVPDTERWRHSCWHLKII